MATRGGCFSYVNIGNLGRETIFASVVVLFVELFPLILGRFLRRFLSILVDFPIQIATIRMRLSILYFKGSQVDIS